LVLFCRQAGLVILLFLFCRHAGESSNFIGPVFQAGRTSNFIGPVLKAGRTSNFSHARQMVLGVEYMCLKLQYFGQFDPQLACLRQLIVRFEFDSVGYEDDVIRHVTENVCIRNDVGT
jgi:hypothetical protein